MQISRLHKWHPTNSQPSAQVLSICQLLVEVSGLQPMHVHWYDLLGKPQHEGLPWHSETHHWWRRPPSSALSRQSLASLQECAAKCSWLHRQECIATHVHLPRWCQAKALAGWKEQAVEGRCAVWSMASCISPQAQIETHPRKTQAKCHDARHSEAWLPFQSPGVPNGGLAGIAYHSPHWACAILASPNTFWSVGENFGLKWGVPSSQLHQLYLFGSTDWDQQAVCMEYRDNYDWSHQQPSHLQWSWHKKVVSVVSCTLEGNLAQHSMAFFDHKCTFWPCRSKSPHSPREWTHIPNSTSSPLLSKSCKPPVMLSCRLQDLKVEVEVEKDPEGVSCHGMPSGLGSCMAPYHGHNHTAHTALAKPLDMDQMWRRDTLAWEDRPWCHSSGPHISDRKTCFQNQHLCKRRCTGCTWLHLLRPQRAQPESQATVATVASLRQTANSEQSGFRLQPKCETRC